MCLLTHGDAGSSPAAITKSIPMPPIFCDIKKLYVNGQEFPKTSDSITVDADYHIEFEVHHFGRWSSGLQNVAQDVEPIN